jgi:hypothetical protein
MTAFLSRSIVAAINCGIPIQDRANLLALGRNKLRQSDSGTHQFIGAYAAMNCRSPKRSDLDKHKKDNFKGQDKSCPISFSF